MMPGPDRSACASQRRPSLDRIMAHMVRCLLLQEEERLVLVRTVMQKFELTGDPKHKTRRQAVYEHVARELDLVVNNDLAQRVQRALETVGVRCIANGNVRLFRGLRVRTPDVLP